MRATTKAAGPRTMKNSEWSRKVWSYTSQFKLNSSKEWAVCRNPEHCSNILCLLHCFIDLVFLKSVALIMTFVVVSTIFAVASAIFDVTVVLIIILVVIVKTFFLLSSFFFLCLFIPASLWFLFRGFFVRLGIRIHSKFVALLLFIWILFLCQILGLIVHNFLPERCGLVKALLLGSGFDAFVSALGVHLVVVEIFQMRSLVRQRQMFGVLVFFLLLALVDDSGNGVEDDLVCGALVHCVWGMVHGQQVAIIE